MQEFDHLCTHPRCYKTENDTTMYEVRSRRGNGKFTVCGEHLIERDVDRAEAIVTNASSAANSEVLEGLKSD